MMCTATDIRLYRCFPRFSPTMSAYEMTRAAVPYTTSATHEVANGVGSGYTWSGPRKTDVLMSMQEQQK